MKKLLAWLLVLMLIFTSCSATANDGVSSRPSSQTAAGEIDASSIAGDDESETIEVELDDKSETENLENNELETDKSQTGNSEDIQDESEGIGSNGTSSKSPTSSKTESDKTSSSTITTTSDPAINNSTSSKPTANVTISSKPATNITTSKPSTNNTTSSRPSANTTTSEPTTSSKPATGTTSSKPTTSTTSSKPTTSTSSTPSTGTATIPKLYINYINVGQGDSILIKVDDCDILIDGGKSSYGSTVSSYLKSKGVDDIELLINSHPDEDHYGGLSTVLSNFKVESFWGSSYSKTTTSYKSFKSAISSEGLSFKTPSVGTIFSYEQLTISVLYNGSGASNSNDSSLVVMIQYGNFRFLFTGDISSTIENKIVSSGKNLKCDVLKVPHHGSAGSSSASFLSATSAKYGVICVGSNSYGHPTSAALGRLSSAGISVYRTDKNGTVVFSTNGSTLTLPSGSSVSGGSGSGSSSSSSSGSGSSTSSSATNNDNFIGNKESKVFHLPTCSNLPAASKRNYLYDYWFIVNCIGYRPCQICLKNYTP